MTDGSCLVASLSPPLPAATGRGQRLVGALDDRDALVRRDAILAFARLKVPSPAVKRPLEAMSRSDEDDRAHDLSRQAVIRLRGAE